jgi:hypothetical protein
MSEKQKNIRIINKMIASIGVVELQVWLDKMCEAIPAISPSLEGIYCGHKGEVLEELAGEFSGIYLKFGWYKDEYSMSKPRVEYAYAS